VDEPGGASDVHSKSQNWRSMAAHLQDDLNDPVGARRLLEEAIEHREAHGLAATFENAQVHIDLARSLGKADELEGAESHLRSALRIYEQVGAAAEHRADLVHYIAVVVDRQRKRGESETLYRQALQLYKAHGLSGGNVAIALKNLALNLRKQGRAAEAEAFVREYNEGAPEVVGEGTGSALRALRPAPGVGMA
jgi:tetratricopeptide (TPR) repeat protein